MRISRPVRNDPYITGAPDRTSCASTTADSASAFCCATAAARVTGLVAPAMMNGVMMLTWPAAAYSISPSAMLES